MNWKLLAFAAAVVGGMAVAARRKSRVETDSARWAEATDPVTRFGS